MSDDFALSADDHGRAGAGRPMRVLTYNIKGGEGADGRWGGTDRDYLALAHVASLIESYSPDVVSLQEIAVIGTKEHCADQVAHLAQSLGMHHAFAPVDGASLLAGGQVKGRDYWGNAVLSRFPIAGFQVHELTAGRPRERRSFLETHLLVDSQVVTFGSVHLSYLWRTTFGQARELAAIAARAPGPFVVAGDFNAPAGSAELSPIHALLNDAFTLAGVPLGHSGRHSFPDGPRRHRDLDHVFVSPDVRVERCLVCVDNCGVSDHNPVLAEVLVPVGGAVRSRREDALADDLFA